MKRRFFRNAKVTVTGENKLYTFIEYTGGGFCVIEDEAGNRSQQNPDGLRFKGGRMKTGSTTHIFTTV